MRQCDAIDASFANPARSGYHLHNGFIQMLPATDIKKGDER
jgi:hypothetical protein